MEVMAKSYADGVTDEFVVPAVTAARAADQRGRQR